MAKDSKYKLILAPASICNEQFLIQKDQNKLFIVTWTARQQWALPTLMQFHLPKIKTGGFTLTNTAIHTFIMIANCQHLL